MKETSREIELGPTGVDVRLPACSVCGRQDETLRYVSYPYVVSIVVLTFRRSFSGLWCRRHRNLRLLAASLITALVGWLGFPFGLIFTPIALLKLVRGGDQILQLGEQNVELLDRLARHNLAEGDSEGATRCLEAILQIRDDAAVRQRLSELYTYRAPAGQGDGGQALPVAGAILGAALLGIAIGALNYLISQGFWALFGDAGSIYVVALGWAPLLALAFTGGLLLRQLVVWTVAHTARRWMAAAVAVAIVCASLALYGLPTGGAIGYYAELPLSDNAFEPIGDALRTAGAVLTRGGAWNLSSMAETGETYGTIYLLIWAVCAIYYVGTSIAAAVSTVQWQRCLARAQELALGHAPEAISAGWLGIAGVGIGLIVLFSLFPQQGTVDYFEALDHNVRGLELWEQGALEEAMGEFEQATSLKPSFAAAHGNLGWAYLYGGGLDEAVGAFREAMDLDPDVASVHEGLGWVHYHHGELSEAILEFDEAIRLDPDLAGAYDGLGWVYYHRHEPEEAIRQFEEAIRLDPDLAHAYSGLGWAYHYLGELDKAIVEFNQAIRLAPGLASAYGGLGWVFYRRGDLGKAIGAFQQAIRLVPDLAEAYSGLGWVYYQRGEFEKAAGQFETLAELQPDWGAPHAFLASVYYTLDELDLMETEIGKAVALQADDGTTRYALARLYWDLRRHDEAEALLLEAIDLVPDAAHVYRYLSGLYSEQGRFDLALQMCDRALAVDGDDFEDHLVRADIYINQEDLERALEELDRAQSLDPDSSQLHSYLSFVRFQQGQVDVALEEAKETVRLQPYSASGHKNLAFSYHAQGDLDLALDAAQRAVELAPKYDTAHYILGLCYVDRGEDEKAAAELSKFLDLYRDRAYVREYKTKAEAYLDRLSADGR
jgi:tetratricopeptide (TPR) repeat protein